jgi:hypothetical protein
VDGTVLVTTWTSSGLMGSVSAGRPVLIMAARLSRQTGSFTASTTALQLTVNEVI